MSDDGVEAFIEQMKAELRVELDRELARELGISPTAVAGWRMRKRIPAKYALRFSRRKDELADAVPGEQTTDRLRKAYLFRLVDAVSRRIYADAADGFQTEFNEMWRGYRLADAYTYFDDMLPRHADKDTIRKGFEALQAEVGGDDFINWIENLGA